MRHTREDTRGAPNVLPFINIKLAAYQLLLYVVYLSQKS